MDQMLKYGSWVTSGTAGGRKSAAEAKPGKQEVATNRNAAESFMIELARAIYAWEEKSCAVN
ncbi:MAG TPA: hypothetical protein VGE93_18510 [Bryobacteraceae bacterium]